jgi:hypothetical protein
MPFFAFFFFGSTGKYNTAVLKFVRVTPGLLDEILMKPGCFKKKFKG